ncbi:hypothetical protein M413DRAFT_14632 [Hebeloma cylindrosporum]|uniref:Uncharacterized protein n=1 Tax=Hebeloma cylindrosporum TaxID=76867 RepID=A0A0C3BV78_HEBCY|nr:hypothetical protein M413DRAFT_14632 [Hebeloma cylindrosporum h7]
MAYMSYNFPDLTQHSGQQRGFYESHGPTSGSREITPESYRALEEELKRTVVKLGAMERDLDIQRALNIQVQAQLDKAMAALATSHPPVPARSTSPVPGKPLQTDKEDADDSPALPPPVAELDPDEYPNACYWTQSSWLEYKKRRANQGFSVYGLDFMRDEDGHKVSEDRLAAMTKRAKQLWNTLYRHRQDPASWGKKCRHMRNSFPEFGLCEGSWKAEAFAIIRYPDWSSKVRSSGLILRKRPSKGKRKHEDDSEDKSAPKTKKQKIKAALPPADTTIIYLDDDDIYADPPTVSAPQTATTSSSTTGPTPPTVSALQTATTSSLTETPSITATGSTPLSPIVIPSTSSQDSELSTISTRSVDSTSTTPPPSGTVVEPTSAVVSPAPPSIAPTTAALSPADADSEEPTRNKPVGNAPRRSRRQAIDPLKNLVVPCPPEEVPVAEQIPAPPASAAGTAKKGDDKELSIPKGLSAKNLYAKEYKKTHPRVTGAEYRSVWDNLDETTRKEFEQLCKAKKAERKAEKALVAAEVTVP